MSYDDFTFIEEIPSSDAPPDRFLLFVGGPNDGGHEYEPVASWPILDRYLNPAGDAWVAGALGPDDACGRYVANPDDEPEANTHRLLWVESKAS